MESIDLTASDDEDDFSSFGSQATDEGSVVFLVEVSNFSSDEDSVGDVEDSEGDDVETMIDLTIVDYCVGEVDEIVEDSEGTDVAVGSEPPDILSTDEDVVPVDHSDVGKLS